MPAQPGGDGVQHASALLGQPQEITVQPKRPLIETFAGVSGE